MKRTGFVSAVVLATLLGVAPGSARAEIVLVNYPDASAETLIFGTDPASGFLAVLWVEVNGQEVFGPGGSIGGEVEFFSGPLLSLTTEADGMRAHYLYGQGVFSWAASWRLADGSTATGSFSAPLLDLAVDTCEGDCFFGLGTGRFRATLGAGTLDPALATLLHQSPFTLGGGLSGDLDLVTGDTSSRDRFAGAPGPWDVTIDAEVPEPAVGSLLLLAGAAASMSRRRRTQPR